MAELLRTVEELRQAIGTTLGPSDWVTIGQSRIDAFAEVTGDRQWIHVDPQRAANSGFHGTIAHGYLTLSLTPLLMDQLTRIREGATSINYGLNRLRFLTPVASGARVRLLATVKDVIDRPPQGVLATYQISYELEGADRPALVAEIVSLLIPNSPGVGSGS
ncbi:MAG TPA: MaoC family dehydratase [Candidatus Dormibacteraeota bacterium]|nr:MaoC family dehydratase [Candidatus Dormibacteraeota bacterium]